MGPLGPNFHANRCPGGKAASKMAKLSTFGKETPCRANPLTDLYNCQGLLYAQQSCIILFFFKFDMIRITGYRVIAEKPRVCHLPEIFRAPCRKKICLASKNDWHIINGLDVLYHYAKFGEGRTTHAGCRCENMVSVCFCLSRSGPPMCCSFEGAYFDQALCHGLQVDFDYVFTVLFSSYRSFRDARDFFSSLLGGARIFAKLRSKIAKSPKIGGKVCAPHFVQTAE